MLGWQAALPGRSVFRSLYARDVAYFMIFAIGSASLSRFIPASLILVPLIVSCFRLFS